MKNTIGSFIAALRKANGMTQQDVADRLNVSNKAVSRWERDECAPDISLIPAIAEMFGITCDELLKGERMTESHPDEKKTYKLEKQIKSLVNRTLSGFKTLIWISLAVALVGLCIMFGISYGIYRPVIGFFIMLLFEVCAFAVAALAVSRTKYVISDNELFENAPDNTVSAFYKTLGSFSFTAFFTVISSVIVSLPVILFSDAYSTLAARSYFRTFAFGIVLLLILIYVKSKWWYIARFISASPTSEEIAAARKNGTKMTLIQCGLTISATILLFVTFASNFLNNEKQDTHCIFIFAGLACMLGSIICFAVFIITNKKLRKKLILPGIRNILFNLPVLYVFQSYYEGLYNHNGSGAVIFMPHFALFFIIMSVTVITLFFELIPRIFKRKSK